MKKLKTVFVALVLSLTFCLGMTGCNFSADKPAELPNETLRPNENAEVTLTTALLSGESERRIIVSWANAFMDKHPEVTFDLDKNSRTMSAMDDIKLFDSAGNMPDIIWTGGDQHSPYSEDYFVDLSKMEGADEFFGGFYDALIDATHVSSEDEGIWFVPRDYNALMVYYNKDIFDDAGVEYPKNGWTWADFEATCEALQNSGKVAAAVENDIGWPPYVTTMLTNYGAQWFNATGQSTLRSAATEAGYKKEQEFNSKYVKNAAGSNFQQYSPGAYNSNVAMYINVRPALPEIALIANTTGWGLGTVTFPNYKQADGSNGFVGAGCSGYAISNRSSAEKQKWAWEFLKFCMSKEGYEAASKWGVLVPAIEDLQDDDCWRGYTWGDIEIDDDAYIPQDITPIFLNYYNMHRPVYHYDITLAGANFWKGTENKKTTYSSAIDTYIRTLKDKCGISEATA